MRNKEQEFKLGFALDCAEALNWELSPDFKKLIFGDEFEAMLGIRQADYDYDFETFINLHLYREKSQITEAINKYLAGQADIISVEVSIIDSKGKKHWFHIRGRFINEKREKIYGVSVNITERKILENRLAQLAYIDSLTGLYRREYISDALAGHVESVSLSNIGLMMLNINRFRDINAVFGHERGDAVLLHTAKRLLTLTDNLIAKMDADRFIIIFNEVSDTREMETTAQMIKEAFEIPLEIDKQPIYVNFKIGITLAADGNCDFLSLMKDAELAVNHVQNNEINHICIMNEDIRRSTDDHIKLLYELRKAVENNEFILHFQPIICRESQKISGAEALIRWEHPQRGIVGPMTFIPLAEQTGLICQIGDFVLTAALKELKKRLETDQDFYISINVSVTQFMASGLVERIEGLLEENSIPPANLIVEITESIFIADVQNIIDMLNRLRGIGVRISLDDFGTGYSSMSYLKKIPLDNLKIDRSFLYDVIHDPASEAILKSIITLARNLNLSITAEGVETDGHLTLLESHGCDYLQGYYYSRPIPADELDAFVIKNR
ncbi:MAG: EAL domain-containing protein [Lachnospiraceae bacterium]|nr:EAL domain-containing protein [Lachnospiraceae bacterium]